MDPFTIKPLDITAVQDNAAACSGRVITVEDHYPEVRHNVVIHCSIREAIKVEMILKMPEEEVGVKTSVIYHSSQK